MITPAVSRCPDCGAQLVGPVAAVEHYAGRPCESERRRTRTTLDRSRQQPDAARQSRTDP